MKRISLQWRLTLFTALLIAAVCISLNFLLYRNGVYYIDSLQSTVIDYNGSGENIYIDIPDSQWDDFADKFSIQIFDTKAGYRRRGWLITAVVTILGGAVTYFVSGHALKPLKEFSARVENVQARNMTDCAIDGKGVPEFRKLSDSYNEMLVRLSDAFEIQRQFTGSAAHELRTPLAIMQAQLELYNSTEHQENDADTAEVIKMVTEQTERLSSLVGTLLDMSELQTVERSDNIEVNSLIDEVVADLEPLAEKRNIELVADADECDIYIMGSDILIYRMIYNLTENAIKYNKDNGKVRISAYKDNSSVIILVEDTGHGIPCEYREKIFEPFFRVDKSRSRELGGVGLGLALVREIVRLHGGGVSVKKSGKEGTVLEIELPGRIG